MADRYWFLNTLAIVRHAHADGTDGISILDNWVPHGDSPPLHIHHTEDEIFTVLEGEFRFLVDRQEMRLGPGMVLVAPRGIPHTYRAESSAGGRFLTITALGDFERLVRTYGRKAERDGLPPPSTPTFDDLKRLTAVCKSCGIDLVGPPLS